MEENAKTPEYRYERLYRNLYNPEFYLLAYKNIAASPGSMTQGADGVSLDDMSMARIKRIIASLKDHSYQPTPAQRTYIAKKNSSKTKVISPECSGTAPEYPRGNTVSVLTEVLKYEDRGALVAE